MRRSEPQPVPLHDDFLAYDGAVESSARARVPAPPADDEGFELGKYLGALQRRWPLILICCLLAAAYALIRYSLSTKMYQSTAVIQIERRQLATIAMGGQTSWLEEWWNLEYYPTQYRLLRSRGMAERVIQNLRLLQDPAFTGRAAKILPQGSESVTTAEDDAAELARQASRLQGGLVVNPIRETQLVELTYRSSSPELAARIANGYAQAFIDWGIETRTSTVSRASSFLADHISELSREIEDLRFTLSSFAQDSDFAIDPAGEVLFERQKSLENSFNRAVIERISKEAEWRELKSLDDGRVVSTIISERIAELRGELEQLEAEYETKLESFTEEWPAMVELRQRIESHRGELGSLVRNAVTERRDQAFAAYQQAAREENALRAELRNVKGDISGLNSTALAYDSTKLELDTKQELLNELLQRQSETEVASRLHDARESNVRVVDQAVVPGGPYRPVLRKDLATNLILGLLLGAGIILLLEFFDRTIKSPEDLEKITGLPTLTVIPDVSDRSRGYAARLRYSFGYGYGYGYNQGYGYGYSYGDEPGKKRKHKRREGKKSERQIELLPHHKPRLAVCEAYRSLRTALLLSSAKELWSVAVTSAEPSEGKTATTTNLAVVMAQLGRSVLVVDCDLRRPRMHKVFKTSNRIGLVNHLTGTERAEDLILPTEVPNLYLCPSGPIPPNPSELLASERMGEFLTTLRSRFDFILLDTPPVLPVVDATIIGQLVDGIVICARAGQLVRDHARACRERLTFQNIRLLGTVVNCFAPGGAARYARKYYYAEGYAEEEEEVAASTAA